MLHCVPCKWSGFGLCPFVPGGSNQRSRSKATFENRHIGEHDERSSRRGSWRPGTATSHPPGQRHEQALRDYG